MSRSHSRPILAALALLIGVALSPADLNAARVERTLPPGGWRFLDDDDVQANQPGFDDSAWESVNVPHTWNAIDASDGGGERDNPASGYRRGPGWYRCALKIDPAGAAGSRYFIRFEGVSETAGVFINGTSAGRHEGAFTAFCFEITDLVHPGDNLLAVRAENTWTEELAPMDGDFPVFGGIYRPVHLITTGPACIDPLIDGSPGLWLFQREVTADAARVDARVALSDHRAIADAPAAIDLVVRDAAGNVISRQACEATTHAGTYRATLPLDHPHLWNGIRDPYRYSVTAELTIDGKVVDTVEQPLGLRSIVFTKEGQLLLNGQPLRLHGVNRHQDREGKGWAVSDADHAEDIALIREMGANAVRLAHYPQADTVYDLCDRAGLLVWAELPLVNRLGTSPRFPETTRNQLRELIHQELNHPSIFVWSLWNELGQADSMDPVDLVRSLSSLAHELDPTRPTVAAANGSSSKFPGLLQATDQIAWNLYPGWYGKQGPSQMGQRLDGWHAADPGRGLGVSEYGAGASIHQHEQNMTSGPNPGGKWHPEEWQAIVHETAWREIEKRPFVWGSFIWNMFDFASVWRSEGDLDGINDKGLVTYDRRTRKDAFFFYQASWSDEPVLYITSRRDFLRVTAETPVKLYCNGDDVELRLNGTLLPPPTRDGVIFRWPKVTLAPGENHIEATARRRGAELRDACVWTLTPDPEKHYGPPAGSSR